MIATASDVLPIGDAVDLSAIGLTGIVTLAVLAVLFGWIFPRSVVTRLWKQLDAKDAETKELRDTLDRQATLIEKVVDQVGDMKVTSQATLYAMQEIQVAGRHAAGMEPLVRSSSNSADDGEC